jgi:hypothetical protein
VHAVASLRQGLADVVQPPFPRVKIMRFVRIAAISMLALYMSGGAVAWCTEPATDLRPRFPPKVLGYDSKRDGFTYSSSVFNPARPDRPAPDINFYGNRLTQFRFIGPRSQSGIYGALDDYKARRQLDPIKYQYRWR